jgi:hypothetical protein
MIHVPVCHLSHLILLVLVSNPDDHKTASRENLFRHHVNLARTRSNVLNPNLLIQKARHFCPDPRIAGTQDRALTPLTRGQTEPDAIAMIGNTLNQNHPDPNLPTETKPTPSGL